VAVIVAQPALAPQLRGWCGYGHRIGPAAAAAVWLTQAEASRRYSYSWSANSTSIKAIAVRRGKSQAVATTSG
jgi:hypothetical protein